MIYGKADDGIHLSLRSSFRLGYMRRCSLPKCQDAVAEVDQVFCSDSLVLIPQSSLKIFPNQNLFFLQSLLKTPSRNCSLSRNQQIFVNTKPTNKDLEIQKVWRLDFSYQKIFCQTSQKVVSSTFFDRLLLTITG